MSGFRRYLFAGDAAVNQATQVPSMANAGDGKVLSVQSNVQAYNCWQEVVLDDNVYEVYRAEVLPTTNIFQSSTPQIVEETVTVQSHVRPMNIKGTQTFQFTLNGMVSMKRIFLNYVWSLTAAHRPVYVPAQTFLARVKNVYVRQGLGGYKISQLPQPEYMMLDAIERVQIIMGTNKLIFENGNMEPLTARKVHMSSLTYTEAERELVATLGLSYAKNVPNFSSVDYLYRPYEQANASSVTQPLNPSNINPPSWTWASTSSANFPSMDRYSHIFDNFFEQTQNIVGDRTWPKQTASPLKTNSVTPNQDITIPLYCLIPFLAQTDTYLPKGFPIEFRIDYSYMACQRILEQTLLYCNSLQKNLVDAPRDTIAYIAQMENNFRRECNTYAGMELEPNYHPVPFVYMDLGDGSGLFPIRDTARICYDYLLLKENILKEFNLTWARQPLLYNYYTWERFDTVDKLTPNNSSYVNYNLLINQQRPLCLYLRFETLINSIQTKNPPYVNAKDGNRYTRTENNKLLHNYRATNDLVLGLDEFFKPVNYYTGSAAGYDINMIEVFVGSQLIYKADTKSTVNNTLKNVHACMDNLYVSNRDNPQGVFYNTNNLAQLSLIDNACPYKINLAQNKSYERGYFALDRGNTNLTINVRLNQNIDVTRHTLALYAVYPAQMTIDRSYTCVETKWPVIIAENGPVVESQYNIN